MRYIILLCSITLALSASAKEQGLFAGLNLGQTRVDLTENFDGESESLGAAGIGFSVGYLTDFNVVTQLGATGSENFSLFGASDRYKLRHLDILVGYQANWQKFSFTPKVGYANWALRSKEGQFFNPGSEDTKKQSGNDFMWAASLGYVVNERFLLSLSHKSIDTGFGGYDLSHIEFLFNF